MPSKDATAPVPLELTAYEFAPRPIVAGDAEMDYAAVMETREISAIVGRVDVALDDLTVEARPELIWSTSENGTRPVAPSRTRCSTSTHQMLLGLRRQRPDEYQVPHPRNTSTREFDGGVSPLWNTLSHLDAPDHTRSDAVD